MPSAYVIAVKPPDGHPLYRILMQMFDCSHPGLVKLVFLFRAIAHLISLLAVYEVKMVGIYIQTICPISVSSPSFSQGDYISLISVI